jgi:glycogen synthase
LQSFQPDVCLAGNLDALQTEAEILHQVLTANVPIAHYVMNAQPGYAIENAPRTSAYRFITCSDWVTEQLRLSSYPVVTAQTIYPGADVDAFYQATLPPHDQLRIAYASLVAPYKGVDVLVEALSLLQADGIPFTATIAGATFQPNFLEALIEYVASEGLTDHIHFVGALSRQALIELYKTHNVLVFPSRFPEPFGISQIEAMAAGLTLVTSGTGGAGEILIPGQDGWLFESENPLDLAEVLASLALDPITWQTVTQRGQQKAITQFSQLQAVEAIELTLLELITTTQTISKPQIIPSGKIHKVGSYELLLPLDHRLDRYQATWWRYDTVLGYIAQAVFEKYPDSCAIDIGANIGDSAALIRSYSDVPILCVEGSPKFLEYLQHNAQVIEKVEIEACFVGNGDQSVNCNLIDNSNGTASILNAIGTHEKNFMPIKSLSTIVQAHPEFVDFKLLKIDTDGFDFIIIQDSIETITTCSVLYFEYDIAFSINAHRDAIETIQLLCNHGFDYFLVYDNFGNYLISLCGKQVNNFHDLTAYLISNRFTSHTPAIYYFDICAFSKCDYDLFESIRSKELALLTV